LPRSKMRMHFKAKKTLGMSSRSSGPIDPDG
jgi:hypothetical protein